MQVIVTPNAKKQIKKLPKFIQLLVLDKLKKIGDSPFTDITKHAGYHDAYRSRVGSYRVVYRIMNKVVYIVLVGHRKEVYLLLKRVLS